MTWVHQGKAWSCAWHAMSMKALYNASLLHDWRSVQHDSYLQTEKTYFPIILTKISPTWHNPHLISCWGQLDVRAVYVRMPGVESRSLEKDPHEMRRPLKNCTLQSFLFKQSQHSNTSRFWQNSSKQRVPKIHVRYLNFHLRWAEQRRLTE